MRFFRCLDPSHTPPHRVAFMRILRLLEAAVFRELKRLVSDNFLLYGSNFASTNSDFYTNTERRESFGCLVANMLAPLYHFEVRNFSFVVPIAQITNVYLTPTCKHVLFWTCMYRMIGNYSSATKPSQKSAVTVPYPSYKIPPAIWRLCSLLTSFPNPRQHITFPNGSERHILKPD
jgi:hypothetical protein